MYKVYAPELEPAIAWLNTTRPLSIKALRGHVVVLDFWTYCCINCMHVVPILREIEHRHRADPVQVIGVHSAKFAAEASPERVGDAIARYGIEHPVVVDRAMAIWERYAIRSWPTLVVIRADGSIAAVAPGEPDLEQLDAIVREQLDHARATGKLATTAIERDLPRVVEDSPLRFPGKIAVAMDGRIAISDSGHHRVVVTTRSGAVNETIGSGLRGLRDGRFDDACFDDPQGVAWDGEALWICDTRNHVVRRANLQTRTVETIAGTGSMAPAPVTGRAPARERPLRSPWDVTIADGTAYVAMAGSHQIWSIAIDSGEAGPFAGTGREALMDGGESDAAFAQPSGLALRGGALIVADSETSSVRTIDLATRSVRTLVGVGLFDWGDIDGPPDRARLQHALGVTVADDGAVLVADTYNDRIRRIDATSGRVGLFYRGDGDHGLREPAAIAADPRGGFVVADTGNHRLVRLTDAGEWSEEIAISRAPAPKVGDAQPSLPEGQRGSGGASWFETELEPVAGRTFGEGVGVLSLTLQPPDGWKLAAGSPARVALEVSRRSDLLELEDTARSGPVHATPVVIAIRTRVATLPTDEVASEVVVTVDAVLCSNGDDARCVPTRGWFRLPITLRREGDGALGYNLPLAAPRDP